MPRRELRAYLFDVQEACERIEEFTRDTSLAEYEQTVLIRSAVERQLEIIGEALTQALRHHPALAGRIDDSGRIIAFRNQLAHGYASTSDEVVWVVVTSRVPDLRERVKSLLLELGE